jgi:homoserine O-acetyltransferase
MANSSEIFQYNGTFTTEAGFVLHQPDIAYKSWGKLNENRDNVVLICHALTGNAEADDWFYGFFEHSDIIKLDEQFVLCINVPGSCYGSTGPQSINPKTGQRFSGDFPIVSIRDMVRFQQILLDEWEISGIELAIGGSMGGMQVLEFLVMDERIHSAVVIGMNKAHSAWAIGLSETQRQAIYNDPNWNNGYYSPDAPPKNGLSAARMMAMLSYRTWQSLEDRFSRELRNESGQFQIESYLNYQGQKLVDRFDALSYVRLTQAMDLHDIARDRGTFQAVLNHITTPVLVLGIDTDLLYPVQEQKELAYLLGNGTYAEITSPHGHDAFLIEFDQMESVITPFLSRTSKKILSKS